MGGGGGGASYTAFIRCLQNEGMDQNGLPLLRIKEKEKTSEYIYIYIYFWLA